VQHERRRPFPRGLRDDNRVARNLADENILTREEISDTLQRAERYVSILGVGPETHGASSLVFDIMRRFNQGELVQFQRTLFGWRACVMC